MPISAGASSATTRTSSRTSAWGTTRAEVGEVLHHHAVLSIAAYGFLMAERLTADKGVGGKKNLIERQVPAMPKGHIPRGSPARAAPRAELDHEA